MAPGNNDRHPGHTGTIPKTKARNNCNVPQEAVTPTRRDMTTNLVSTSLDWVPVSEYNTRGNYNQQSRKPVNNISDHELNDLDNSAPFESGFGRFVPVRPQPRVLPLNVQNQNLTNDNQDDTVHSSASGHSLHPYAHQMQNGLMPQSNHATAAVMIVNPTTPNAITGNISQPFNAPNQNRNNLTRNLNPARNNFEGSSHSSNNNTPPISNSRTVTKTVNIMNNMYDQGQGSYNNLSDNNGHRESARALGEAIVAACPDAAAVERRLGQIREYIRVTSSLVDTMRNSEDEAYIEHTKEEYDELVQMVMKLKESESKLESMLVEKGPDNIEVPAEEDDVTGAPLQPEPDITGNTNPDKACNIKPDTEMNNLKKVTNLENEQINKTLHDNKLVDVATSQEEPTTLNNKDDELKIESNIIELKEIENTPLTEDSNDKNEQLRQNIISCVEKVALIEELKNKKKDGSESDNQDVVVRPVSVQSNGSTYSENELWQNEIKNKMEMSQIRLTTLKQQQKRLLKFQEEAKQQLDEMNSQSQDIHPSTSHDNYSNMSGQAYNGNHHPSNRIYTANQIGVATTLSHGSDSMHGQSASVNGDHERFSSHSGHSHDERHSGRGAATDPRDSDPDDEPLGDRARDLHAKLRDLQLKKQHMENLVSEFQKLQAATARAGSSRNTYSSSGEDSGADEAAGKFAPPKSLGNVKNEDPFKLMEIKAIKTALQKTKDLMRSVENYEAEHLAQAVEEALQTTGHGTRSNHVAAHDSKSEGGGSLGGWSNDGSLCRVRNQLPPRTPDARDKFNNERHSLQQHHNHEENIATLQELAQELRMETEKIMGERARIKDMVANKEPRRQKKVNEEVRPGAGAPGPAERRQMQLRALLADKQRELEALLTKEKVLSGAAAAQQAEAGAGCSYGSEPDEPDSVSEPHAAPRCAAADSSRRLNAGSSRRGSVYGSDSDSTSRNKLNQRNRRRRQPQEIQVDDNPQQISSIQNMRNDSRDSSNVNLVPPISQSLLTGESPANMPYPHLPPPCWNTAKSNQDMRNQFTQNSHSQTMDRLLGTPQMSFPPSMPYNMMMPYGMAGGCGCGCGVWGAWCWQQLALQQRDILQLREQVTHLEERWRAETASHTLNNQVPPGNRANNYWDNFRSYSRQNLLSTSSKTNADAAGASGGAQPLPSRSHNALQPAPSRSHNALQPAPPSLAPKRNAPPTARRPPPAQAHAHSHANNLNSPANVKKKSSSKLPAKNSTDRKNYASTLDYSQTSNVNIASTSDDMPNPNLACASREPDAKATSKLFDLLRENVYSEVTALIGVNESHPDFLIQLFRELQMISSDPLRQRVLRSIRNVLSQYDSLVESRGVETEREEAAAADTASAVDDAGDDRGCRFVPAVYSGDMQIDGKVIRFLLGNREDTCSAELLDTLTTLILSTCDRQSPQTRQKLLEYLFKFEGMRLSEVSGDIVETLPVLLGGGDDGPPSAALQDVAGALEPYASGDARPDVCPYDMWPAHVHVDVDAADDASSPSSRDGNGDLVNCSEIQNGDLAEADQTCAPDSRDDDAAPGAPVPHVLDADDAPDAHDAHQDGPASKGLHCVDYET